MNEDNIEFGEINTQTGERLDGYVDNGEMKFKKEPWYKRLFKSEPTEIEYMGLITMSRGFIWSDKETEFKSAVYRKYNPVTNKTKCIYTNVREHGPIYFDIPTFEKMGKLVEA